MPSLFNRRSRSVSTSRPSTNSSSSAHVAAAQAFLANRQPQGNLSSAAAAAALRSMSPAPTPVDQVQTKRMLNRQTSNASVASAARGRSRSNVQRRPSNGSMTERTFRTPSPGRQAPTQAPQISPAPPVPPLPTTFATEDIPPLPQRSHRRSMSLENWTTRTVSPPPTKQRQTSATNAPAMNPAMVAARRSAGVPMPAPLERSDSQDSRSSYNFSYPRGSRPTSPPPRPTVVTGNAKKANAEPPATNGISGMETARIQRKLTKTAEKPVKKKKKVVDHTPGEGAHLQAGSMSATPHASSALPSAVSGSPTTEPATKVTRKQEKPALTGENTHFPEHGPDGATDTDANALDPAKERRAQRAAGVLMKQPSVVREDWEGEQEEVRDSVEVTSSPPTSHRQATIVSPQPARSVQSRKSTGEANVSRKMEDASKSPAQTYVDSTSGPSASGGLAPNSADAQTARQSSASPSRSFRFSDRLSSDLTAGRKHNPLPRSISPAKSALKHHSPSRSDVSVADGAYPQQRGSSRTPSESSEISVDIVARKKAHRVSFEASPEIVTIGTDTELAARSHKDGSRKGWLGFGKAKSSPLGTVQGGDETDDGMKPRPALPSFGSVRKGRVNDSSPSPASRKVESVSGSTGSLSEASSTVDTTTAETSVSSDHALGRVLFKEPRASHGTPLPPEVTSVEGTGYVSDSDLMTSDDDREALDTQRTTAAPRAVPRAGEMGQDKLKARSDGRTVPAIAIQPATPGLDATDSTSEWIASVPGGFPGAEPMDDEAVDDVAETAKTHGDASASVPPAPATGLGLSDEQEHSPPSSPTSPTHASPLNTITEESSDNDSLYSDAAEDLSDQEGDGFGSINAIVESPMVAPSPTARFPASPSSPSPLAASEAESPAEPISWDQSQAYWSGVSQQLKNNVQGGQRQKGLADSKYAVKPSETTALAAAAPLAPSVETRSPTANQEQNRALANRKQDRPPASDTPKGKNRNTQPVSQNRSRSQPAVQGQPPVNKNVSRLTGQSGFRHSMRDASELAPTLRPRPQSMINSPTQARQPAGQTDGKSPSINASVSRSRLQRTLSNDSDSDSSFKRVRTKRPAGSGFARRTMRAGAANVEATAVAPQRERRPIPPSSSNPASPAPSQRMRMSMRGSSDLSVPTMRNQQETKRSSSLFSRARKAKSPTRPISSFGLKPKSRLADSDDEDGDRPTAYRSRFANSSDEEDEPFRPVRGIPRRKDDADSTDLDDSSDDQRRKPQLSTPKKPTLQLPSLASPAGSEPQSPATAKKKGLWGRLRGNRKEKTPNTPFTIAERNKSTSLVNGHTAPVTAESTNATDLGFKSTAERDALVAATLKKLEAAQDSPTAPSSPSGKLVRRGTPQRVMSDSWPLSPKVNDIAIQDRPVTSAGDGTGVGVGILDASRPGMGDRQPTSETVRTAGGTPIYGRTGKKKKFPFLRKAFGLMD